MASYHRAAPWSLSCTIRSLSTIVLIWLASAADCKVFNVLEFGVKSGSSIDNGLAFTNAWKAACSFQGALSTLVIPKGIYMFKEATFIGPCKAKSIVVHLNGDLKAFPGYYGKQNWLSFRYIDRLTVTGRGTLDGQGQTTWHHNDCQKNPKCGPFPANLRFDMTTNSTLRDITSINSKSLHINLFACNNFNVTNVRIKAPAESPNTDGIHLGGSQNIRITNSIIGTGDDCISFSPGTHKVTISGVVCGPGHGISIGSMGRGKAGETVTRVRVLNTTFVNTNNGVRVKTWPDSFSGLADNLIFENIEMRNVLNPVIIDQEYCPTSSCKLENPSRVQVKNVFFKNIHGTSSSKVAINLKCSRSNPCQNVQLQNINLAFNDKIGTKAISNCKNVRGSATGRQNPPSCI